MLLTARSLSKVLQLTLAVIKPDAVAHPLMLEVSSHHLTVTVSFGKLPLALSPQVPRCTTATL